MTRTDARVRYALAFILAATALAPFWDLMPWWGGSIAGVLAIVMMATAATRYCPIYALLRIRPLYSKSDEKTV